MDGLRIFNNPELGQVRMVMIDDKPYFVGNDVARILEYSRPNDAITANCKGAVIYRIHTPGGMQNAKVIPEGDMYRLIVKAAVQSNSEKVRNAAEKFEKWIFDEVVPEIRRAGSYSIDLKMDSYMISDPVERAKRWIEEQEESRREKQVLEEKVSVLEPDASAFQALCDSKLLTNFRDGAKELGMSQSQFIGWLKHEKYIYSTSKGELRPMEAYRKSDLFRMKSYTNPNNGFAGIQTYLTPKGLQYFKMQFEARGIIPEALPKHGRRNGRKRYQKSI